MKKYTSATIIRLALILIVFFTIFFRFFELNKPDIIEDEDGHVRDAIAFYHSDPFIVPRHHTFRHTPGNMGHPFFHHFLIFFSYKLFSPSNAASRLPSVAMSIISALVVYHMGRKMFSERAGLIGASFYLLSPLVFRVSRTANIDATFAAMGGFSLYYFYLYLKEKKLLYSALVGFFSALLFSSKINGGIIFAVFAVSFILLVISKSYKFERKDILSFLLASFVFTILFILLNDPHSYLDALLHPADHDYQAVYTNPLEIDAPRLNGVLFYLFPLHFTLFMIISVILSLKAIFNNQRYRKEYILLLISLVFFFTGFRFGLERGLLVFLIPACVLTGKFATDNVRLKKPTHLSLYFLFFLLFIPSLIFWGFRTKPLPIPPYDPITHYFDNRLQTFRYLNELSQEQVLVTVFPSTLFFPSLNVREGIELIPLAFRDPQTTDYFLTDSYEVYQNKLTDPNYKLVSFKEYNTDLSTLFKRVKKREILHKIN